MEKNVGKRHFNFIKELLKLHPEITTIVQNINNKFTSMVLGEKETILYGKGYIEDVKNGSFPEEKHTFTIADDVLEKLY